MNSAFRLLAVVGCLSISFADAFAVDSHAMGQEAKLPISFGVRMDVGGVFPTNDFVKGGHFDLSRQTWEYSKEREVHDFSDVVIQMNFGVRPDRWQARAYRNPYYGVASRSLASMTNGWASLSLSSARMARGSSN